MRTAKKIEAVIFDFGGVLGLQPSIANKTRMANILGMPLEEFHNLYMRYRRPYNISQMGPNEYWTQIGLDADINLSTSKIEKLTQLDYQLWTEPNQITIDWVKQFSQQGFRTALLSDMPVDHRDYVTAYCDWFPRFDHLTFSGEIQCAKPDFAIYQHCLNGLGIQAKNMIFIDDRLENTAAAAELKFNTITFVSTDQTANELEHRFGIKVPISVGRDDAHVNHV